MTTTCPPEPLASASRPQRPTSPPTTLWSALDTYRQRQLAQCLAVLIQRLQPLGGSVQTLEDTDHDLPR